MKRTVRWEELFKDEMEEEIAKRPVCYLAYGLSEPHGPQSVLGLDGHKAHGLVERVAQKHGGVVAPAFWWHVSETPHELEWLSHQNAPQPFLTDVPPGCCIIRSSTTCVPLRRPDFELPSSFQVMQADLCRI